MRIYLSISCAALLGAAIVSAPKPASALTASPAVEHGQTQANLLHEVRKNWKRGRNFRPRAYTYRPYGYRGYRGYGYNRPYYGRNYGYYGYRRPGVSLWFGL